VDCVDNTGNPCDRITGLVFDSMPDGNVLDGKGSEVARSCLDLSFRQVRVGKNDGKSSEGEVEILCSIVFSKVVEADLGNRRLFGKLEGKRDIQLGLDPVHARLRSCRVPFDIFRKKAHFLSAFKPDGHLRELILVVGSPVCILGKVDVESFGVLSVCVVACAEKGYG